METDANLEGITQGPKEHPYPIIPTYPMVA